MNKFITLALAVLMMVSVFSLAGCKKNDAETSASSSEGTGAYDSNVSISISGKDPEGSTGSDTKSEEKVYNIGFEPYVSNDADIVGSWRETTEGLTSDKIVWTFYESATLHITETKNGISFSTVCTCLYDEDTKELSYFIYDQNASTECVVSINGNTMKFLDQDGNIMKTFEKQ